MLHRILRTIVVGFIGCVVAQPLVMAQAIEKVEFSLQSIESLERDRRGLCANNPKRCDDVLSQTFSALSETQVKLDATLSDLKVAINLSEQLANQVTELKGAPVAKDAIEDAIHVKDTQSASPESASLQSASPEQCGIVDNHSLSGIMNALASVEKSLSLSNSALVTRRTQAETTQKALTTQLEARTQERDEAMLESQKLRAELAALKRNLKQLVNFSFTEETEFSPKIDAQIN